MNFKQSITIIVIVFNSSFAGWLFYDTGTTILPSNNISLTGCTKASNVYVFSRSKIIGNNFFVFKNNAWNKVALSAFDSLPLPFGPSYITDHKTLWTSVVDEHNSFTERLCRIKIDSNTTNLYTDSNSCIERATIRGIQILGIDKNGLLVISTDSIQGNVHPMSVFRFDETQCIKIASDSLPKYSGYLVSAYARDSIGGEWFVVSCFDDACIPYTGLYKLENGQLTLVKSKLMSTSLCMLCKDSLVYIGHYDGMTIYNIKTGTTLDLPIGPVKSMLFDHVNNLWVSVYSLVGKVLLIKGQDTTVMLSGINPGRIMEDAQHRIWVELLNTWSVQTSGLGMYTFDTGTESKSIQKNVGKNRLIGKPTKTVDPAGRVLPDVKTGRVKNLVDPKTRRIHVE